MASPSSFSPSPPSRPRARRNPWSSQTNQVNGYAHSSTDEDDSDDETRSPSSIFLHTYSLALVLGSSLALFLFTLLIQPTPFWRLPFFLLALSLFHTLEYYITARYNPAAATTAAFLLNNGKEYNIAHCLAFLECVSRLYFFPSSSYTLLPDALHKCALVVGAAFMVVGQCVRSAAMGTAGSNFNHIVQSEKKSDHVLVTEGVYAYLRHPSYFGFFWWGIGTQIVLGNVFCLVGYTVVLWRFFRRRIENEEKSLIHFFGEGYVRYRRRTRVAIPLIT